MRVLPGSFALRFFRCLPSAFILRTNIFRYFILMCDSSLLFYGLFTRRQVTGHIMDHSDQILGRHTYILCKESVDFCAQKQNQGEIVKEDEHDKQPQCPSEDT